MFFSLESKRSAQSFREQHYRPVVIVVHQLSVSCGWGKKYVFFCLFTTLVWNPQIPEEERSIDNPS